MSLLRSPNRIDGQRQDATLHSSLAWSPCECCYPYPAIFCMAQEKPSSLHREFCPLPMLEPLKYVNDVLTHLAQRERSHSFWPFAQQFAPSTDPLNIPRPQEVRASSL
ncbi:Uncharacterised protein [Vibrio cholerae]|nr:Uncharacterised protein [Vibrio cholerae]